MKSRRLTCKEDIEARMGITNDSTFVGKPEVKELLYRSRHRCELRIKYIAGCEDVS
jgi:hypothetical protein